MQSEGVQEPIDLTGATRVGVISDTHGEIRPELYERLAGVDAILHAGDLGRDTIAIELLPIAPFYAVAGNVDGFSASEHPRWRVFRVGPTRVGMTHVALGPGGLLDSVAEWVDANGIDVLVYGHTHRPEVRTEPSGLVLFNPGSCGPQRFSLPVTYGMLRADGESGWIPELFAVEDGRPFVPATD